MVRHEDETILDELRRLGEQAIEQAAAGDFGDAYDTFRAAAWLCQGIEHAKREAAAA